MDDTAKMVRPKFPRNPHGPGGRVEHDTSALAIVEDAIVEDAAGKSWDGHKKHRTQTSDISALTSDDKTKRK